MKRSPAGLFVVSGGQTGADRAALDAARALGLPHGGWCPRGRRAEDGEIGAEYALWETDSGKSTVRTRRNVAFSDATLILARTPNLSGGTALTRMVADELGRPCLVHRPDDDPASVRRFLDDVAARTLNVAGPRASGDGEVYGFTGRLLEYVLAPDAARLAALGDGELPVSFWLLPAREERERLGARIREIEEAAGALPFVPHLTLATRTLTRDAALELLASLGLDNESLTLTRGSIEGLEEPRRRLFLPIEAQAGLAALHERLGVEAGEAVPPHLSLSYAAASAELARTLEAELLRTARFDELWAVATPGGESGALDPACWVLLGARPLSA